MSSSAGLAAEPSSVAASAQQADSWLATRRASRLLDKRNERQALVRISADEIPGNAVPLNDSMGVHLTG